MLFHEHPIQFELTNNTRATAASFPTGSKDDYEIKSAVGRQNAPNSAPMKDA